MIERLSDYLKTADTAEFLGVSQNTSAIARPCDKCMMVFFGLTSVEIYDARVISPGMR